MVRSNRQTMAMFTATVLAAAFGVANAAEPPEDRFAKLLKVGQKVVWDGSAHSIRVYRAVEWKQVRRQEEEFRQKRAVEQKKRDKLVKRYQQIETEIRKVPPEEQAELAKEQQQIAAKLGSSEGLFRAEFEKLREQMRTAKPEDRAKLTERARSMFDDPRFRAAMRGRRGSRGVSTRPLPPPPETVFYDVIRVGRDYVGLRHGNVEYYVPNSQIHVITRSVANPSSPSK